MNAEISALASWGAEFVRVPRGGKFPAGDAWPNLATADVATVEGWIQSGHNVGIVMGRGNLIDVEYDDDAGCRSIESHGLLDIETPTWASGRGEHRLFRLVDKLPPRGWLSINGMDVRLGGKSVHSVLPPSLHANGRLYEWLVSPVDCAPAAITLARLGMKAPK